MGIALLWAQALGEGLSFLLLPLLRDTKLPGGLAKEDTGGRGVCFAQIQDATGEEEKGSEQKWNG